ncbi:Dyp-type peroxidase [Trametes gibbosa]|nr:Dyp-type peroxidase [Trametes gibbosa]
MADLNNVQGDIIGGLPKKVQQYLIFTIDDNNVPGFRKALNQFITLVTTAAQVQQTRSQIAANKKTALEQGKTPELLPLVGVNIAFSHFGLRKMGINDNLQDALYMNGQKNDSQSLGDPGEAAPFQPFDPHWDPAFKSDTHGVILIAGDSDDTVTATREKINQIFSVGAFGATIHETITLKGNVRPGDQKGHEHFGFMDGISQPAVKGIDTSPFPGQGTVRQGVILCGREHDNVLFRPGWMTDGSFMVLRWYRQNVPEFNTFLKQNPIVDPGLTPAQGSELRGARFMGRWKSGAPIDVSPFQDDPELAVDATRNNDFTYTAANDQVGYRCPLAAHTRKGNPRNDLDNIIVSREDHRIIRRGIPFGPEMSADEISSGVSQALRGLIFVCYQSNIGNGFKFIQNVWANDPLFPPKQILGTPGFDPIIGQVTDETGRTIQGTDPLDLNGHLTLPTEWVIPQGGEYYFSPSISALRTRFAQAA